MVGLKHYIKGPTWRALLHFICRGLLVVKCLKEAERATLWRPKDSWTLNLIWLKEAIRATLWKQRTRKPWAKLRIQSRWKANESLKEIKQKLWDLQDRQRDHRHYIRTQVGAWGTAKHLQRPIKWSYLKVEKDLEKIVIYLRELIVKQHCKKPEVANSLVEQS